ncbi:MAG: hypothetical protein ACR2QV_02330 [Gammaproteobacteria bacterium]
MQRTLPTALFVLTILALTGCSSPSSGDGRVVGTVEVEDDGTVTLTGNIPLPTDTLLNLNCADVGISPDICVLDDPENPFLKTATGEFDEDDPESPRKFLLFNQIPEGPTGAKARFYFWATALARRPSGENQWYTALALHELFTAAGDPIVREQALKAYRSVWDNFFGSVTVFSCCGEFFPFEREDTLFGVTLNELTLELLVRAADFTTPFYPGGYEPLIPDDPDAVNRDAGLIELEAQEVILDWGYTYSCTGTGAARFCAVSVTIF